MNRGICEAVLDVKELRASGGFLQNSDVLNHSIGIF